MKEPGPPLGIYYLLYSKTGFRCHTQCIVVGTQLEFFEKVRGIPDDYLGYFEECRTPGKLVQGTIADIKEWVEKHLPDKYGEPLL